MSSSLCGKCSNAVPVNGEFITCSGCDDALHIECAGIQTTTWTAMSKKVKKEWRCVKCRAMKLNKLQPPRRLLIDTPTSPKQAANDVITDSPTATSALLLLTSEISNLSKEVQALKTALNVNNEKFEKALVEINKLKAENVNIKAENLQLQQRLADLEQYTRSNNLILSNVPYSRDESVADIVCKVGALAGTKITHADIDCCHRLRKHAKQSEPDIIVKFCRRTSKQALLRNKRSPNLTRRELGYPDCGTNAKIFINEHLTAQNGKLLMAAKTLRNQGFKFIWHRGGKIFVRMHENSPVIWIREASDITNLIKTEQTILSQELVAGNVCGRTEEEVLGNQA